MRLRNTDILQEVIYRVLMIENLHNCRKYRFVYPWYQSHPIPNDHFYFLEGCASEKKMVVTSKE